MSHSSEHFFVMMIKSPSSLYWSFLTYFVCAHLDFMRSSENEEENLIFFWATGKFYFWNRYRSSTWWDNEIKLIPEKLLKQTFTLISATLAINSSRSFLQYLCILATCQTSYNPLIAKMRVSLTLNLLPTGYLFRTVHYMEVKNTHVWKITFPFIRLFQQS